ncbi:titin [Scaptodrosophila lebanonensis]|uniref:Titin n=1 Tax=Drosophila lebanonensis TaxID=7225 RepID=A0A6J2TZ46_DROLE|nr:titin [Scaptodrosophila lebanonensis]XP_030381359.1 titin [Scaptodrosophila lebanonensis]
MTDVSHELGSLRFVVDSPLSSKVAMFNNQATQHKQSQLLNPFSQDGRASSPKPTFSKDQYGKPLAGSLTEMRGQKANIHVMKEMVELCQIISSEGYEVKDEPTMRVIPFGELFNIYNYISDKVVGILLRARKHKLVEFEGEMLFQRRDDDVPIFLLKPVAEIRRELEAKIEDIKRATSPAPQSTSVLLDKSAHEKKLQVQKEQKRQSKSRTPSPAVKSKSTSPTPTPAEAKPPLPPAATPVPTPVATTVVIEAKDASAPVKPSAEITVTATPAIIVEQPPLITSPADETSKVAETDDPAMKTAQVSSEQSPLTNAPQKDVPVTAIERQEQRESMITEKPNTIAALATMPVTIPTENAAANNDLPTIVIEASAVFVRTVSVDNTSTKGSEAAPTETVGSVNADPDGNIN